VTTPFMIGNQPHPFLIATAVYTFDTFKITDSYSYYPPYGSPDFADQTTIVTVVETI
jgi:hypothetical protein